MFIRLGAITAALLLLTSCASPVSTTGSGGSHAPDCATSTSLGKVAGRSTHGACAFQGIPYAAPPTGKRRFRPPQPARPWQNTLRATNTRPVCPQNLDTISEDYPDDRKAYTDEDCLYLNVWTPKPDQRKRPVIVFIHGGAARFGTGNEPRYDGTKLTKQGDAVVVTLNYRLGVLGWSELGGLDPSYAGSGNNGLRDQMQALRWVHKHIADFGGDPSNVTVAGESEGAFGISAMLATAHPEHLFRRAVLESGSGALVHSAAFERKLAAAFPVRKISDLRHMSTRQILELQEKMIAKTPGGAAAGALFFGPYVDGDLVRGPVTEQLKRGNARSVDLLIGTNRDEMKFFGQLQPHGMEKLAKSYDAFFPPQLAGQRKKMAKVYRKEQPHANTALAMFTDQGMRVPAIRMAQAQSRWRRTYMYEFAWSPPKGVGAVHTAELPFVFGSLRFTGIQGGAQALKTDRARLTTLSHQMMDAWASFARSGDPNARRTVTRPTWPAYRAPRRATMIWKPSPTVTDAPRDAERAAWDDYPFGPFTM